jgi:hypothetical protein
MSLAANAVIEDVLLHGSQGMRTVPRTEVGLVAAVVLGGVNRIAAAWAPVLSRSNMSLNLIGVFCHAAPLVRFQPTVGNMQTCELADLLLVVDFTHSGGITRIATLVQAKMAAKARRVSLTGPSSTRQLGLYQAWPQFSFVDSVYGADRYLLATKAGAQSGTFGVIDRHFRKTRAAPPIWTQHPAVPTPSDVTNEPMLGTSIAEMVGGGTRGRRAWPGGRDDWSKVIDLLLRVTYGKAFRHRPTLGPTSYPRGITAIACLLATVNSAAAPNRRSGGAWRPPFDGFDFVDSPDPGGISMIHARIGLSEPS